MTDQDVPKRASFSIEPTSPLSSIVVGVGNSEGNGEVASTSNSDVESNSSTLKEKGELGGSTRHSIDEHPAANDTLNNDTFHKYHGAFEMIPTPTGKENIGSRFFRFLFHNGVPSHSLRFLISSLLLFSLFFLSRHPLVAEFTKTFIVVGKINIFSIAYLVAWFLLMISTILILLHSFVVLCHRYRVFYENRLMHYINELEVHISFIITCIISYSLLGSKSITTVDLEDSIDKISNLLFAIFVSALLLAVKSHYITVLAISFNYNNYKDRIQDSIFGDRIISSLLRARSAYKSKMKKKNSSSSSKNLQNIFAPAISLFGGAGGSWGRGDAAPASVISRTQNHHHQQQIPSTTAAAVHKSPSYRDVSIHGTPTTKRRFSNTPSKTLPNTSGIVFSGGSLAHLRNNLADDTYPRTFTQSQSTLPLSAMNIFSTPATPTTCNRASASFLSASGDDLPKVDGDDVVAVVVEDGTINVNSQQQPKQPQQQRNGNPSVTEYLSESDKKRQFEEFSRLANTTITRFSNLTDYRVEIKSESQRLALKVFKYLQSQSELTDNIPETSCVYGAHMLPWLKGDDFCSSIGLLRRHSERSSFQSLALCEKEASLTAFSASDLCAAFEGILMELYQTAKSLQTIETAIEKVDLFITFIIGLIVVIVLSITMFNAIELLLAITTMLSGAAFAFSTSAKNMFESMIFLLVIHPFDVGDRVFIPLGGNNLGKISSLTGSVSSDEMDNLVVSEMHLLSTSFERWDGVKLYIPNYLLSSKPIINIRRSGPLIEIQRIMIDFATPLSKIDALRLRLHKWVTEDQEAKQMFTPLSRVCVEGVENCNRLTLNIFFQHQMNWQDLDGHLERRSRMVCFLNENISALDIGYMPPVQRVAIIPCSDKASLRSGESDRLAGSSLV